MQHELIDMLEEIISYVEVWHKEDQDVIDRAEALVAKAKNNNAPDLVEQELSALLTTSLPYMTPVGRARLGQDIAQLYSSVSAPAVPQGWAIKFEGNDISVSNDHMGCIVPHTETVDRKMPSEVLHALCRDLLAAAPAPAPAQEAGLTDEEIEAIAKKHMSTVGDHWSNEEAIREIHAEDFARDIIAALRAKGGK